MKQVFLTFYKDNKYLVWLALVGSLAGVILVFAIFPQIQALIKDRQNLADAKTKLQVLDSKNSLLGNLDDTALKQNLQTAVIALPEDIEPSSAFGVLQQTAYVSGVNIAAMEFSASRVTAGQGIPSFSINVVAVSTKSNLGLFLKNLTQSPVVMNISGLNISSTGTNNLLAANLQIEAFYSPPPDNSDLAGKPLPKISPEEEQIMADLATYNANSNFSSVASNSNPQTSVLLPRGKDDPFH